MKAFRERSVWAAAHLYRDAGFSVIPCNVDKRPAIAWKQWQSRCAGHGQLTQWFGQGSHRLTLEPYKGYQSIGLVCGAVSGNLVVIDLDGMGAVHQFAREFPEWIGRTRVVRTGSGKGCHLYTYVHTMPDNANVRTVDGGFELRGNGCYVIAPPSGHPSGGCYRANERSIATVDNLDDVYEWMQSLRTHEQPRNERLQAAGAGVSVGRISAYMQAVVSGEVGRVRSAGNGNRNNALFYAACRLANYAAGGEINWQECQIELMGAALSVGVPRPEVERTIESAWNIGSKRPKVAPKRQRS